MRSVRKYVPLEKVRLEEQEPAPGSAVAVRIRSMAGSPVGSGCYSGM